VLRPGQPALGVVPCRFLDEPLCLRGGLLIKPRWARPVLALETDAPGQGAPNDPHATNPAFRCRTLTEKATDCAGNLGRRTLTRARSYSYETGPCCRLRVKHAADVERVECHLRALARRSSVRVGVGQRFWTGNGHHSAPARLLGRDTPGASWRRRRTGLMAEAASIPDDTANAAATPRPQQCSARNHWPAATSTARAAPRDRLGHTQVGRAHRVAHQCRRSARSI